MMRLSKTEAKRLGITGGTGPRKDHTTTGTPQDGNVDRGRARSGARTAAQKIFRLACAEHGLPAPTPEYVFHRTRKWRFDWAFREQWVALEIQGGIFVQGRHSRGAAMLDEFEKLNAAAEYHWRVVFVTPKQVDDGDVFEILKRVIFSREW